MKCHLCRRVLGLAVLVMLMSARVGSASALPAPVEVASALPGARLQGNGQFRFVGLRVYDARLWTGERAVASDWRTHPFALELEYQREFGGEEIAIRSLAEMRRQAELGPAPAARWLASMKTLFPDVKAGDRITGLNLPEGGARFYFNGTFRGEVNDAEFTKLFFGIWLSPQTSAPSLREKLLGRDK